jgi:NadR type nicotinamide-nucleotide adenylyltransferase
MTRGFVLGTFMPPHQGHVMLCEFAQASCDTLTILVCSGNGDPLDGGLRAAWMRELFPAARVVHLHRDLPRTPDDHPGFWAAMAREAHPEPIDVLFASEAYGTTLAQALGARFVPFDPGRTAAPFCGPQVRADPYGNWHYLPVPVRAHYVKSVCLFGPESTGKTTLGGQLAKTLGTILAPEYGRTYCEVFGNECDADDLLRIARGQRALEWTARRHANKLLVLDTDVLMTAIWSEMLLGRRIAELDATPVADFYLLADIDIAWQDDGLRYFPDQETRQHFFDLCRARLEERQVPYVVVRGEQEERLATALAAIAAHFPALVP